VNIAELRTLLEETHGTTLNEDEFEQLKDQMKAFDFSQDGELQYEEFLVLYAYSDAQKKKAFQVQARKALSADTEDDDDKNLDQRIHIDGVPMFAVQRYLRKELDETAACIQLPWAVLLFCGFMLSVMWHFRFERLHAVDEAITWDIEQNANFAFAGTVPFEGGRMGFKTIYDVNSIPDFWSWFNMGLTPLFWPSGWDTYEVRGNTATECSGTQDKLKDWGGYDNFVASVPNSPGLGPGPCAEGQDSPVCQPPRRSSLDHLLQMEWTATIFCFTASWAGSACARSASQQWNAMPRTWMWLRQCTRVCALMTRLITG
jgi:hypothetical protein